MPEVRREEMAAAARHLGVQHRWLGFIDSGLPEGDPKPPLPEGCFAVVPLDEPTRKLVEVIREFRPHVMTTYDENGGYPHPDHIRCHEVSMAAYEAAADPNYHRARRAVGSAEGLLLARLHPEAHRIVPGRVRTPRRTVPDGGVAQPLAHRAGRSHGTGHHPDNLW